MGKSATVANLDGAVRLCRERTLKSTCFRKAERDLSRDQTRHLQAMEALLYSERRRIDDCAPGSLMYPEAQFICSLGCLCYHFSEYNRRFILTHFELISQRSAKADQPCVLPFEYRLQSQPRGCVSDVAARLADIVARWQRCAFAVSSMNHIWSSPSPNLLIKGVARSVLGDDLKLHTGKPSLGFLRNVHNGTVTVGLPHGSALEPFVAVREQLENPYARAILAGEEVCRVGWEISAATCGGRFSVCSPVYHWSRNAIRGDSWGSVLFEESRAVIQALTGNMSADELASRARSFATASLVKSDTTCGDSFIFVYSELVLRLALALNMQSSVIVHLNAIGLHSPDLEIVQHRLLHKYALLSEFASMSERHYGIYSDNVVDPWDLIESKSSERWGLYDLLSGLLEFRGSTNSIVHCEDGSSEINEADVSPAEMQSRLIEIAAQIIEVT